MDVNQIPSKEEWRKVKAIFTQLYIEENRKLHEVRQILADELGFVATEKAYKRRIRIWKIRKNYSADEKDLLAQYKQSLKDTVNETGFLTFGGKPIRWDKVHRHSVKVARKQFHLPNKRLQNTSISSNIPNTPKLLRVLQDECDIVLGAAKRLVLWRLASINGELHYRETSDDQLVDAMWSVPMYLERQATAGAGWEVVRSYCHQVRYLLETDPFTVWHVCTQLFARTGWNNFTELRKKVLNFVSSLSSAVLPEGNPLKYLLKYHTDIVHSDEMITKTLLLQFDTIIQYRDNEDDDNWYLIDKTLKSMVYVNPLEETQRCVESAMQSLDVTSPWRISYRCRLALACFWHGEWMMALEKFNAILKSLSEQGMTERLFYSSIYSCLTPIHDEVGDVESAISCAMLAFQTRLRDYPSDSASITVLYYELESLLTKNKRCSDVEQLRLEFANVIQHLNIELPRLEDIDAGWNLNCTEIYGDHDTFVSDDFEMDQTDQEYMMTLSEMADDNNHQ